MQLKSEQATLRRRALDLMADGVVWDNHSCMPLRPDDERYLPQLERFRTAGINVVSINVHVDLSPPGTAPRMLATFRRWIAANPQHFVLASTVADIVSAKRNGKLAITFDVEGGRAVENDPSQVEALYRLGVRWLLIAYNKNNRLGGGCQDDDCGLTGYGKTIIDEMQRVGMVLCCSHTGYKTALEAMEYSRNPVIFSHSNPRAMRDHDRNIPDELMRACANTGGVININGIGIFLGDNDSSTSALMRHIDYAVERVGASHVGLGLDYVFDRSELDEYVRTRPDIFPPTKGYQAGMAMVEPERFPEIAEELLKRGYSEKDARGILGENNLRVAQQVWRDPMSL